MADFGRGIPRFLSPSALLPADAQAHAWVAQELARGLPHGWVSVCSGGFPFGPHYQSLAIVLSAVLLRVGMAPISAVNALGVASTIGAPLLVLSCLRAANARPAASAAGAAVSAWCLTPYRFITPVSSYVGAGVLSQTVGIALALAVARAICSRGSRAAWWAAPVLGALAVTAHVQVTLVAFLVTAPLVALAAPRGSRERYLLAAAGAFVVAVAIYLPGLATMHVPLSWSKSSLEGIRNFPDRSAFELLTGEMLDNSRPPGFTALVALACAGLLASIRTPAARGVLALFVTSLLAAASGRLAGGSVLVEVFAPHRAASMVPLASGAVVAFGLGEWSSRLARFASERIAGASGWAVAVAAAGWGAASSAFWVRARIEAEDGLAGAHECGASTPDGYRTADVAAWLRDLPPGRLLIDAESFEVGGVPLACPSIHGLELASPEPVGASYGGPGTQVGVLQQAFDRLAITTAGADGRAEVLGVRTVLHARARPPGGSWTVRRAQGDVVLSQRTAGTAFVGAGCVRSVWRGADRAVRDRLFDVGPPPGPYDDPRVLVLLEAGTGPVVEAPVVDECDASTTTVTEQPRESGAYEAVVQSLAPFDVVIRATYFPTWRIEVDGTPQAVREVAPGFPSARVPPGTHRVVAVFDPLPHYRDGIVAAIVAIGGLAWLGGRRGRVMPREAAGAG
jgi:hypothetical protein